MRHFYRTTVKGLGRVSLKNFVANSLTSMFPWGLCKPAERGFKLVLKNLTALLHKILKI
ncbi:MAG: hypothetical protein Ct9H300mP23_10230 [Nitrospinota bacterium]|nr:MAG: hypothetical protein Ct9H300mP23_10230 [Nitrospinota bacterium]